MAEWFRGAKVLLLPQVRSPLAVRLFRRACIPLAWVDKGSFVTQCLFSSWGAAIGGPWLRWARELLPVISRCSLFPSVWVVAVGGLVSAAVPRTKYSILFISHVSCMPSTEYTSRWFVAGRRNPCARNCKTFSACLATTLKWRFGDDVLTGVKEPLSPDATLLGTYICPAKHRRCGKSPRDAWQPGRRRR